MGNNISDIFNLPVVKAIDKITNKGIYNYRVHLKGSKGKLTTYAGDWLVETVDGDWYSMTDKDYKELRKYYDYLKVKEK